jgi:ubiquinone/menaquinone biosynthesis C-methylase UbiE
MAKRVAEEHSIDINFISGGAEEISLPDNFFDTALVTYTMCTIPEVIRANIEIKRVLKETGKLIFCEHGVAPDENIAKWQSRIDPIWGKFAGGCHLNRDIPSILEDSGFKIIELDQMYLPNTPKVAGYNYWGFAVGIN